MLAAMNLGADGVQIGSRFVATPESSAHLNFKNAVINSNEGDTMLTFKELTPVRLLKNEFYKKVEAEYEKGANVDDLKNLLGRGRAKKGMFEGDMVEGELEIGQIAGLMDKIIPAQQVVEEIIYELYQAKSEQDSAKFIFE
jgi:enoyl-[acyl-carrier protein] reductase II